MNPIQMIKNMILNKNINMKYTIKETSIANHKLKLNMYKDAPYDITKEVSDYVFKHETVDVTKCCNDNDWTTAQFAFVFDVNNDVILKEYKKNLENLN